MKNYFLIVLQLSLLLILLLSSCKDIINSDENINKYDIHYNYVLTDQTHNVIMPLHVGNNWIFNVKEFKSGSFVREYFDTIKVVNELLQNNEKWFEVMWINDINSILYLTNTDAGLWMKCNICDNRSTLEAQYPSLSSPYLACKYDDMHTIVYNDTTEQYEEMNYEFYRWTNIDNFSGVVVPAGSFNGLKFINGLEDKSTKVKFSLSYIPYYVPDLGPIKFEYYVLSSKVDSSNLNLLYELIRYELYE
ncbi:MAG: hypothetical protein EPN82_10015 [Bacteroidetes bacterium]|nr:MAG: hypothetical protein EPN82_10015 [Bacteroidota bacterium]